MSKNRNTSPLFYVYWDNSKLNEKNIIKYINDFSYEENDIRKIEYPTNDLKLVYPKDNLDKLMKKRQSSRLYNDYQLNVKQLSSLFSCFTQVDNHRLLSSAGGKYPIEVYALCFNVNNFNNKIVFYTYSDNSLSIIGNCQDWDSLKSITGVGDAITGRPSIMFVFVGFPDRVVSKYGERGGRFLLIESGPYIQNLLLRITYEKL